MEVAKTVRVQPTKRLIDETDLPLSETAFNAVFAEVYKRQPSEIRRRKRTPTPSRK